MGNKSPIIKTLYTFLLLLVGGVLYFFSNGIDANTNSIFLDSQVSTGVGSNNSQIQIFPNSLRYVNKGNNSSVIGNYFEGSYYDSIYGNFEMDWSANPLENVRVVGTTSACGIGDYGYKLGGYAYSSIGGYVDFDYNNNIFVYYCISDNTLRGYAHSSQVGYQNFRGIEFDIAHQDIEEIVVPELDDVFNVFETQITTPPIDIPGPTGGMPTPPTPEPNVQALKSQPFRFNGQTIEFIPENESFFYIIK